MFSDTDLRFALAIQEAQKRLRDKIEKARADPVAGPLQSTEEVLAAAEVLAALCDPFSRSPEAEDGPPDEVEALLKSIDGHLDNASARLDRLMARLE